MRGSLSNGLLKFYLLLLVAAFVFAGPDRLDSTRAIAASSVHDDEIIAEAFRDRARGVQVSGQGTVARLLPDDNDGSRHQRFILQLASGQTLLIAHNIDLAPRIPSLRVGDSVLFFGVYEWNSKGGVIHWTHHDPAGRHTEGWLQHNGETYQ